MTGLRTGLVAILTLSASGCGGVFAEVPPTFAHLAEPVPEVRATQDSATLVLVYASAPYDGGRQAVTVIRQDLQPVGQIVPRSFAVSRVPPGEQVLVLGIPELDSPESCHWIVRKNFDRGKVYVVNVAGFGNAVPVSTMHGAQATTAEAAMADARSQLGKTLSKLSHMTFDPQRGAREVQAHASFWQACVGNAIANEKEMAQLTNQPPGSGDLGIDKLEIPPPP